MKPKLEHVKKGKYWYWRCPICNKLLSKHKVLSNGYRGMYNLQSKGAASRHLGSHDPSYVNHGRNIMDITNKRKLLSEIKTIKKS